MIFYWKHQELFSQYNHKHNINKAYYLLAEKIYKHNNTNSPTHSSSSLKCILCVSAHNVTNPCLKGCQIISTYLIGSTYRYKIGTKWQFYRSSISHRLGNYRPDTDNNDMFGQTLSLRQQCKIGKHGQLLWFEDNNRYSSSIQIPHG